MKPKKKVIIAGGGFAGIQLIKNLDKKLFDILLIDRLNYHQFTPLFYQVASSQIEPASISFPFRFVFRHKKNVQVRMAEILSVDSNKKILTTTIGDFDYDYLVIATGSKTNFFGNKEIEKHALTLKTVYDAIIIRNRILQTFENVISASETEKEKLLNLVIVGGGSTGVELAGAFAEIKKNVLPKDYPGIDFSKFKVTLVEGARQLLNHMSEKARTATRKYLEKMGVEVITEAFVTNYDGETAVLSNGIEIKTRTVIWTAGVTCQKIEGIHDNLFNRGNRILVDHFNKVKNVEHIYAIGDTAMMETDNYPKGHPQIASVAIKQAKCLAKNLKALEKNKAPKEFEYTHIGSMATIGNNKAVADFPVIKVKGFLAWLIWMFLHLMLILSVKNKLIIFINWAWKYITKNTSLRLILSTCTDQKKS